MSAVEVILAIKKMPRVQRRKVYRFVDEELRREEERRDNEAANRALKEKGANIPWSGAYAPGTGKQPRKRPPLQIDAISSVAIS